MRTLRLHRETLPDIDLSQVVAGGPPTYNCFISYGQAHCLPTLNGCPWTGDPCLLTGIPLTYDICS
jgi:hypothetical protein